MVRGFDHHVTKLGGPNIHSKNSHVRSSSFQLLLKQHGHDNQVNIMEGVDPHHKTKYLFTLGGWDPHFICILVCFTLVSTFVSEFAQVFFQLVTKYWKKCASAPLTWLCWLEWCGLVCHTGASTPLSATFLQLLYAPFKHFLHDTSFCNPVSLLLISFNCFLPLPSLIAWRWKACGSK